MPFLTEDEAKTKWCPMARQVGDQRNMQPAWNRSSNESWECCVGSACMMWRWIDREMQEVEYCTMGSRPDGGGWECTLSDTGRETMVIKSRWKRRNPHRSGHCGLAGEPK